MHRDEHALKTIEINQRAQQISQARWRLLERKHIQFNLWMETKMINKTN